MLSSVDEHDGARAAVVDGARVVDARREPDVLGERALLGFVSFQSGKNAQSFARPARYGIAPKPGPPTCRHVRFSSITTTTCAYVAGGAVPWQGRAARPAGAVVGGVDRSGRRRGRREAPRSSTGARPVRHRRRSRRRRPRPGQTSRRHRPPTTRSPSSGHSARCSRRRRRSGGRGSLSSCT